MSQGHCDPLWIRFPRWLEHSGLPGAVNEAAGPAAWAVFRKLVEWDCERNLTPHWFICSHPGLARAAGVDESEARAIVERLREGGWIETGPLDEITVSCRIQTPLPVPVREADIRLALENEGYGGRFVMRYMDDLTALGRTEQVVYLYQMVFGARFNPRIAEDLEEIANTCDIALIHEAFDEARQKKGKSMGWIRSRIEKRMASGGEESY